MYYLPKEHPVKKNCKFEPPPQLPLHPWCLGRKELYDITLTYYDLEQIYKLKFLSK